MKREQAQRINPIIGDHLADTLSNAAQAIDAGSLFQQGDAMPPGEGVCWGRYAYMQCVRAALEFEAGQLQGGAVPAAVPIERKRT